MTRRERLERKLEKRREWAEKATARSSARFGTANKIMDGIPMGQPILVGHHSERHARRDAERIDSNLHKGVEESKLAEHHESCADGIERVLERSVFDDDADAIEKLEARIKEREESADRANAINKAWRKGGAAEVLRLGLASEAHVAEWSKTIALCPWLKTPLSTTGLRASARKDRERIEEIKTRAKKTADAEAAPNGVLFKEAGEYCVVTFAEKPDRSVLDALKAAGFWWAGGSWQGERAKLPAVVAELVWLSNSLDKPT